MTASAANGFAQVLYEPAVGDLPPGSVHVPPDVRDLERAHARPVGGAHLQRRLLGRDRPLRVLQAVTEEGGDCLANDEGELDADDTGCFSAAFSLFVPIGGCIATDNDFDGVSYQPVWPGTDPNRGQDTKYHPSSITFTSPLFNGTQNYSRVAFEADLPRIEAADFGGNCNRFTGANCVNPPPGSNFYPIYTTGTLEPDPERALRLAARRHPHQGHDEHVRRELGGGVRAAALQLLPEPEPGDPAQDEQLPQRPGLESLPGLTRHPLAPRRAPSGALFALRLRPRDSHALQVRPVLRRGFRGAQSRPTPRSGVS